MIGWAWSITIIHPTKREGGIMNYFLNKIRKSSLDMKIELITEFNYLAIFHRHNNLFNAINYYSQVYHLCMKIKLNYFKSASKQTRVSLWTVLVTLGWSQLRKHIFWAIFVIRILFNYSEEYSKIGYVLLIRYGYEFPKVMNSDQLWYYHPYISFLSWVEFPL